MVKRPDGTNRFEFVVVCALRAAQLQRGCTPRVDPSPKIAVTAQHEIAERKIVPVRSDAEPSSPLSAEQPLAPAAATERRPSGAADANA